MSEQNPSETAPEHFAIEQQVFASERLPPAAHAATDFEDGTDVELEELNEDGEREPGGLGPDGNLSEGG